MNYPWFTEWKNGVEKLNTLAKEVSDGRDEAYSIMSDKLKKIFAKNGTATREIRFSDDGSVITITFDGNTESIISFSKTFLINIGMPFTVKRTFNCLAENELYLELYPFEED